MLIDVSRGIEIKSLTKIYGKGSKEKVACRNLDLAVEPNQVIGLLGPNGAGKSTLLKVICGFHYPSYGTISVCGTSDFRQIRAITGYVPEFPSLDKKLTVLETLFLEARLRGLEEDDIRKNVSKALKIAELEDVANQKVATLSKGYTQRTSFAKALCFDPKVLILDEFSGGLDPAQTVRMRKAVEKLSEGRIVIQSTHRIEEAQQLCQKIFVMNKGSIVAGGTIDQIVKSTGKKNLEEAFLFLTNDKTEKEA